MALFTRRKAIGLFPFVTLASPSSLFLFKPSSANAQAVTKPSRVQLLKSRWPTSRIAPYVHRQSIPSSRRGLEVTKPELGAGQRGTRRVDLGGAAFPQS